MVGGDLIMKKAISFMKKHPVYHAMLHGIGGIGVGMLIVSFIPSMQPVNWGIALVIVSLLGHLYSLFA